MDGPNVVDDSASLHAVLDRMREAANDAGLLCVYGLPRSNPAWLWDGEPGTETDFVDIATKAGARLLYYHLESFKVEDEVYIRLSDADLVNEHDEESSSLLEEAARKLRPWTRYDTQVSAMTLVFIYEGLAHGFRQTTRWFETFDEELGLLIQEFQDTSSSVDDTNARARDAAERQQSETLAFDERYARARNQVQRKHVASELFPNADRWEIERLVDLAGLIYWDKIEPEREIQLAKQVVELKASGLTIANIAVQLGTTKDRVNRVLAVAESQRELAE